MSSGDSRSGEGFVRGLIAGLLVAVLLLALIEPLREVVLPATSADRTSEALDVIEDAYFRETDGEDLENASVEGMVRRIKMENDDRFSHFFDAETYERFQSATDGQFTGIGTAVTEVKEGLRISQVYEDTPAEEAGIEVGDVITEVEGRSIAGESATEASAEIKGPEGSEVTLTITDGRKGKPKELTLERAEVRIPAVTSKLRNVDGTKIGYASLATFSRGAHGELRAAIEDLYRKGAEGLVLDLRGNGGGLVDEAILVTSIFQEDGPVLITEGRSRPREVFETEGDAIEPRPTVVLTNRDTASASEIVTAALQQNDLATVVGTRTFGKGTFQEVIELDDGGALDLTVGEYLTADGTSILDKGVKPDIRVGAANAEALTDAKRDRTLSRGLRVVAGEVDEG